MQPGLHMNGTTQEGRLLRSRQGLFFLFFLLSVLGDFCKQRGPSVVTQPSAGQTIKGSSNSVWLVALPSGMEKVTAPGISRASIRLCQDWRRLLCQNNNVDIHHKRPSPPTVSPDSMCLCVCLCVCVCVWGSSLLPVCPLWNKSSQVFISLVLSVSLSYSIGFPYHGWTNCLPPHALPLSWPADPPFLHTSLPWLALSYF